MFELVLIGIALLVAFLAGMLVGRRHTGVADAVADAATLARDTAIKAKDAATKK